MHLPLTGSYGRLSLLTYSSFVEQPATGEKEACSTMTLAVAKSLFPAPSAYLSVSCWKRGILDPAGEERTSLGCFILAELPLKPHPLVAAVRFTNVVKRIHVQSGKRMSPVGLPSISGVGDL